MLRDVNHLQLIFWFEDEIFAFKMKYDRIINQFMERIFHFEIIIQEIFHIKDDSKWNINLISFLTTSLRHPDVWVLAGNHAFHFESILVWCSSQRKQWFILNMKYFLNNGFKMKYPFHKLTYDSIIFHFEWKYFILKSKCQIWVI